jgi:hypothetical protein
MVAGSIASGEFVFEDNDGFYSYRWTYSGTVIDDTPVVTPSSFSIDGIEGSCAFAGAYIGEVYQPS